jgi:hypothetical protein
MARLHTSGAETKDDTIEGWTLVGTDAHTYDTGSPRSGSVAFKVTGSTATSHYSHPQTFALGTTYYARMYIKFDSKPANFTNILQMGSANYVIAYQNTTNQFVLRYNVTTIGSASPTVTTGQWYRIEMSAKYDTGALDAAEFRLDGVTIASETGANRTDAPGTTYIVGVSSNAGPTATYSIDDFAFNDSTGSAQNSWPGDGSEVLLLPTADSAVGTGWTLGSGGTPLFGGVDNTPPTGVADTGTTAQIRNATSNANSAYDATMTTYTAAGVPAGATINVVDPIVATGAPVSTGAKQGTVGLVSNPAITPIALAAAGVSGAFWQGNAAAGYPTGWKISHGTVTYAPAVTLGTAPVMRINQVTSSTRIAMVCFMGVYVDYTPAAAADPRTKPSRYVKNDAVHRSTRW